MFAEPWGIPPINKRARGIGALGILYLSSRFLHSFRGKLFFRRCSLDVQIEHSFHQKIKDRRWKMREFKF